MNLEMRISFKATMFYIKQLWKKWSKIGTASMEKLIEIQISLVREMGYGVFVCVLFGQRC